MSEPQDRAEAGAPAAEEPGRGAAGRAAAGRPAGPRGLRGGAPALQAAEEAKAIRPSTRSSRPTSTWPTRRRTPFEKLAAAARRLSAERVRTIVETLLFLAERPLTVEEIRQATGVEAPRAREGARPALRPLPRGAVRHRPARGGRRLAAPQLAGQLRLRPALPQGEAAAAHPRGAGDAGHHRLPAAGDPPRGRGDPRRRLRRGGEGAAGAASSQDPRQEGGAGPAHPLRHHPRVPGVLRAEGPGLAADAAGVPRALGEHREIVEKQAEPAIAGLVEQLADPSLQPPSSRPARPSRTPRSTSWRRRMAPADTVTGAAGRRAEAAARRGRRRRRPPTPAPPRGPHEPPRAAPDCRSSSPRPAWPRAARPRRSSSRAGCR